MFNIQTFEFSNDYSRKDFDKWELSYDYHCLYILENGRDAYVGESQYVRKRAFRHTREHREQHFTRMHIVTGSFMEATPAKHFERLLVRLMKVDGRFKLANKVGGFRTHYERKNEFELRFDQLWDQLAGIGLVKMKDFRLILNSNAYKYSPYTALTGEQTEVLNHILNVLNTNETAPFLDEYVRRPILINGGAGTGKTVVATSLFHRLRNDDSYREKKMVLVVANPQMRNILKEVFANTGEGLCKKDVVSPIELTKRKYDIAICDEVHALRRDKNLVFYKRCFEEGNARLGLDNTHDELDWILQQAEHQILFYDDKQRVKHSDISDDYVKERIHRNKYRGFRSLALHDQMRIRAGGEYVAYVYDILYGRAKQKQSFSGYEFKLFGSFADLRKLVADKDDECGLSKLCGGYAWAWNSKDDDALADIVIEDVEVRWNRDQKLWLGNMDSKKEMGSIYTLRGSDLNYVGLVIGPDLYFDRQSGQIRVNKKSLFSNDVKKGATEEEIREYVLNTYAVLFTRAIEGTYVYVCDEALREYFSSFMELA